MEIKKGLKNQTSKYLSPLLRTYYKSFQRQLMTIEKVAWGIGDDLYKEFKDCKYNLFLLIKSEGSADFLDYFRSCNYYSDDYRFDQQHHIIVIKLQKKYYRAYNYFLESRYSLMFNLKEVKGIYEQFVNGMPNPVYYILSQDKRFEKMFQDILLLDFGLDYAPEVKNKEWDYPLNYKNEIFNYKEMDKKPKYEVTIFGLAGEATDGEFKVDNTICDGISYQGDDFQDYISGVLEPIAHTFTSSNMYFKVIEDELNVIVTYETTNKLTPIELESLLKYTSGQLSDGIGEGFEQEPCMYQNEKPIYLSPWFRDQVLTIEQDDIH